MELIARIAESRIAEAQERGELDDLPGSGKPLPPDEAAHVPPALRLAYRALKNAGFVPPEVELRSEIYRLDCSIADCSDPEERVALRRARLEAELRLGVLADRHSRRS